MSVITHINADTAICRSSTGDRYIAKKEYLTDLAIVHNRIALIDMLRHESFPCPAIIEIEGRRFVGDDESFTIFQEYVPLKNCSMYNPRKTKESVELLLQFQQIACDLDDDSLRRTFRPIIDDYLKQQLTYCAEQRQQKTEAIIFWLRDQLDDVDALRKRPCHASFRHHNLLYGPGARLYLIDFFHGLTFAPRIYDLCVLLSIFAYGVQYRGFIDTACRTRIAPAIRAIRSAKKWGIYRKGLIEHVIDAFAPTCEERDLIIPCFYMSFSRNRGFCQIVESPEYRALVQSMASFLHSDNHPL